MLVILKGFKDFFSYFTALTDSEYLTHYSHTSYISRVFKFKKLSFIFLLFSLAYTATPLRNVSDSAEQTFLLTNLVALVLFVVAFLSVFFITHSNKKIYKLRVYFHLVICMLFSILVFSYSNFHSSYESPDALKKAAYTVHYGLIKIFK